MKKLSTQLSLILGVLGKRCGGSGVKGVSVNKIREKLLKYFNVSNVVVGTFSYNI